MTNRTTQPEVGDEALMAFADGLLDEPEFSRVAEALEQDEQLAARLEALIEGAKLAKLGFAAQLEPVSPRLEAAVRSAIRKSERSRFSLPLFGWRWGYPAVGAAAVLLVALVSLPLLDLPNSPAPGELTTVFGGSELQEALNTIPSGVDYAFTTGSPLRIVSTFRDAEGTVCREFETSGYAAIACRPQSSWEVALAVSVPTDETAYRPASGVEALDGFLDAMGAGAPLTLEEEEAILEEL